jgi:type VII secretion-associated serine protease mycosin
VSAARTARHLPVVVAAVLCATVAGSGAAVAAPPGSSPQPSSAWAASSVSAVSSVRTQTLTECDPDVPKTVDAEPPVLARLGAAEAWELATGRDVVVAVVDSGVDVRNEHLTSAVLTGTDLVGLAGDPQGHQDHFGHGTAVAGQIAARPVTGSGVVGLAPDATILPVRVYYGTQDAEVEAGTDPRIDRTAAGILWAVENGARVINVSLSFTTDAPVLHDAVRTATERGALVVASAGNRTTTDAVEDSPRYPAAYDEVLGVTAVDDLDRPTAESIHGDHVDIAAPGTNVLTTFHAAGDCMLGGTASTSFATGYVSAVAALVAERFPEETPAQWAYRLTATAARQDVTARDDLVGWGVVRPVTALTFADDGTAPGPASPVHDAPPPPVTEPPVLPVGAQENELAPAQAVSAWWLLGGVAALVAGMLASRLRPRRRPRSR